MKLFKGKVLNIYKFVDLNQVYIKVVSRFTAKKMFTKFFQKFQEKTIGSEFLFSEVAGLQVLLRDFFKTSQNIFYKTPPGGCLCDIFPSNENTIVDILLVNRLKSMAYGSIQLFSIFHRRVKENFHQGLIHTLLPQLMCIA